MKAANYQLEKAHIDLTDLGTQMVLGSISIFLLCLGNYLPIAYCCGIGTNLIEMGSRSWSNLYLCWQIMNFLFYFASCMLTAFICLEISGRSGHRLGASPALWAGLLFSVFPLQVFFCLSSLQMSRIVSLLILLTIWLVLRKSHKDLRNYTLFAMGIVLVQLCGFFWPKYGFFEGIWMMLVSAVLVIAIVLCCLTAMSNYRINISRLACFGGLIVLVLMALGFEQMFTSCQVGVRNCTPGQHS